MLFKRTLGESQVTMSVVNCLYIFWYQIYLKIIFGYMIIQTKTSASFCVPHIKTFKHVQNWESQEVHWSFFRPAAKFFQT